MPSTEHRDYAIVQANGLLIVHQADCPEARAAAAAGYPVATMLGCQQQPGPELIRHTCLPELTNG